MSPSSPKSSRKSAGPEAQNGDARQTASPIAEMIHSKKVIICCGSGGVGKTTVSAALALSAAKAGKRVCVVTIDPARRLADAFGLEALENQPRSVAGDWPGELWALMLDTKVTFDDLINRHSANEAQAQAILNNKLYRNLSGALSGTQEYMAMEKLYELYNDERFDLVVVDTPPTRNAIDFLEAPKRLANFLENKIFRLLMMPTRAYLRAVSLATRTFLRTISKVVGAEVVTDAVEFFHAFEGLEEGFRQRAHRVESLFGSDETAFILATAPKSEAIDEAMFFAKRLLEIGLGVDALIVNRVHPKFDPGPKSVLAGLDATWPNTDGERDLAASKIDAKGHREASDAKAMISNWLAIRAQNHAEEELLAVITKVVDPAPVVKVPLLQEDVHDLAGIELVAEHLVDTQT